MDFWVNRVNTWSLWVGVVLISWCPHEGIILFINEFSCSLVRGLILCIKINIIIMSESTISDHTCLFLLLLLLIIILFTFSYREVGLGTLFYCAVFWPLKCFFFWVCHSSSHWISIYTYNCGWTLKVDAIITHMPLNKMVISMILCFYIPFVLILLFITSLLESTHMYHMFLVLTVNVVIRDIFILNNLPSTQGDVFFIKFHPDILWPFFSEIQLCPYLSQTTSCFFL